MNRAVLFWDIDGTLLTTRRAGVFAFEDATRELTGQIVDLSILPTGGLTDFEIAKSILVAAGQPADLELVTRLIRRYEELLPASLFRRQGQALPGVREALTYLRVHRRDVVNYLLTGNTLAGARAKLTQYHLSEFFDRGAFSKNLSDRIEIAREALALAESETSGSISLDGVFVIGDTPRDIMCGNAIGARTIAVATGDYTFEELREQNPWLVIQRIPAPVEFLAKLGLTT